MIRTDRTRSTRSGVILVVVLALLGLFAVVALTFVLYADATANASRISRDAEIPTRGELDPELLLSYFLGQLIYDVPDNEPGVYSALRGHSLARSMLGLNDAQPNIHPFSGIGPFHGGSPFAAVLPNGSVGTDDYDWANYTYFPGDGFLRDPERVQPRLGPTAARGSYYAFNGSYTYPDRSNMFLARLDPNGRVVTPSFHPVNTLQRLVGAGIDPWNAAEATTPQGKLGKYVMLRPRPSDHAKGPGGFLFPPPEDGLADVKNMTGAPGGNDSVWLDLGFPVMTAPDGRKFKPLFAPLVIDLDNRLNLLAHGNIRGGNQHLSHQGWGPWEVNLSRAFGGSNDWLSLFTSTTNPSWDGRYGTDAQPQMSGQQAPSGSTPRYYSQVNYDGAKTAAPGSYQPSDPFLLPQANGQDSFSHFPTFSSTTFGNGDGATERTDHPLLYNPFYQSGNDRVPRLSNMEAVLRFGETGSPMLTSDLFRMHGTGGGPEALRNPLVRRLLTLRSFDVTQPGATPWVTGMANYTYDRAQNPLPTAPTGGAILSPTAATAAGAGGEFGTDTRSLVASLGRVDLNRPLPAFPLPDPATGKILDIPGFRLAQRARVALASEIFVIFLRVTGASIEPKNQPRFDACRWLAQLAVNIVDFLDGDDYSTVFQWSTNAMGMPEFVYGTELPRVTLREAYAEVINDTYVNPDPGLAGMNPKATRDYKLNVWVELGNALRHDPLMNTARAQPDAYSPRDGRAFLEAPNAAYPIYQVHVTTQDFTANLRNYDNATGDPQIPVDGKTCKILGDTTTKPMGPWFVFGNPRPGINTVLIDVPDTSPSAKGFSGPIAGNSGFYVIGPPISKGPNDPAEDDPFPVTTVGTDKFRMATIQVDEMSLTLDRTTYGDVTKVAIPRTNIALRRLACPALPPNPAISGGTIDPAMPINPYITVDTLTQIPANMNLKADAVGNVPDPKKAMANAVWAPVEQRSSYGRPQPYAGDPTLLKQQKPYVDNMMTGLTGQPQNTFFQHNLDGTSPGPNYRPDLSTTAITYPAFDWLVHHDRQMVSPMEVLHVSGYKPHELTQKFYSNSLANQHRVPWFDESNRLYRAFEFLSTASRLEAASRGGAVFKLSAAVTAGPSLFSLDPPNSPGGILTSFSGTTPSGLKTASMTGITPSGVRWSIGPGTNLIVGSDDETAAPNAILNQEVVEVAIDPTSGQFQANFSRPHPAGTKVWLQNLNQRLPGLVNINTVQHEEILQALTDPQGGNSFTAAEITTMFQQLISLRDGSNPPRPFRSLATGMTPANDPQYGVNGSGINDTVLRPLDPSQNISASAPRLFQSNAMGSTSAQYEVLTKLFNHLTTRSNVFGVWLTVGFFEVKDATAKPAKLGDELGKSEGRNVRHRMFAIVDRTQLSVPVRLASSVNAVPHAPGVTPELQPATLDSITGSATLPSPLSDVTWKLPLQPGMWVTFNVGGANEETVQILTVDPTTNGITAMFTKSHAAGEPIFMAGNPGPQQRFDVRANRAVVPYFSVID